MSSDSSRSKPDRQKSAVPVSKESPSVMDFTSARDDHLKALKRNRQFFESDTEVRYSTGIGSLSPLSVSGKRSLSSVVIKNKKSGEVESKRSDDRRPNEAVTLKSKPSPFSWGTSTVKRERYSHF